MGELQKTFRLPQAARQAMAARGEADYPDETCGFVFAQGGSLEVHPMANIQNRLHREDPKLNPRDARTAYCFDPLEMQRVLDQRERDGQTLAAIYHSHPDHDSYFSETDSAAAAPFGEPSYPGVVHLVLSVRQRRVVDLKAFDWSDAAAKYVEIPIEPVE
jgi:proteasome lid subunit RPN8/RPN11